MISALLSYVRGRSAAKNPRKHTAQSGPRGRRQAKLEYLEPRCLLSTYYVDDDFNPSTPGWGIDHFSNIQAAVDAANPAGGDAISVAAGAYQGTINIDGFAGLSITGVDRGDVFIRPSSTLPWNVGGYGSSRRAVVRVVDSTDVALEEMTFDFSLVKANGVHGLLYWDSTGTIERNVLENLSVPDALGGLSEIGAYLRAPGYSLAGRAEITVSDNQFVDTGRVGVVVHDYVDARIQDNLFYKPDFVANPDFGYAVEMGSESVGEISGNTIWGFNAQADDGSQSAGILIESSYTDDVPAGFLKRVVLTDNEVFNSLWGLSLGNVPQSRAGDVDVEVIATDNSFHDNSMGGVLVSDQGSAVGTTLTLVVNNSEVRDNQFGYYIYTVGNAQVNIAVKGGAIEGNVNKGIYLDDYAAVPMLDFSVESLGNSPDAIVIDAPQLRVVGASDIVLSGKISGRGGLTKEGSGTLTLTRNNTYVSETRVVEGTLMVNGSTASSSLVTVFAGATLAGVGSVKGDVLVKSGGTISPGPIAATLGVGNLSLEPGAQYVAELRQAQNDRIVATGDVHLDGTLTLTALARAGGPLTFADESRTIVTAPGGTIDGSFAHVPPAGTHLGYGVFLTDKGANHQTITYTTSAVTIDVFRALAGDTDGDRDIDADDIQRILAAAKYNTGLPADWTEGDFNGDGICDSDDIQLVLSTAKFNAGPYAPPQPARMAKARAAADAQLQAVLARDAVFKQTVGRRGQVRRSI